MLFTLLFAGCDSSSPGEDTGEDITEEEEETPPLGDSGSFTVDGTSYSPSARRDGFVFAVSQEIESASLTVLSVGMFIISGDDLHGVGFVAQGIDGPGTYSMAYLEDPGDDVTGPAGRAEYSLCRDATDDGEECTGGEFEYETEDNWTLVITELSEDVIAGEFEFAAQDEEGNTVSITEGAFSASLTSTSIGD